MILKQQQCKVNKNKIQRKHNNILLRIQISFIIPLFTLSIVLISVVIAPLTLTSCHAMDSSVQCIALSQLFSYIHVHISTAKHRPPFYAHRCAAECCPVPHYADLFNNRSMSIYLMTIYSCVCIYIYVCVCRCAIQLTKQTSDWRNVIHSVAIG